MKVDVVPFTIVKVSSQIDKSHNIIWHYLHSNHSTRTYREILLVEVVNCLTLRSQIYLNLIANCIMLCNSKILKCME